MSHTLETNRVIVEDLPELGTEVAVSTSMKQQEVGGVACLFLAGAIAVYVAL